MSPTTYMTYERPATFSFVHPIQMAVDSHTHAHMHTYVHKAAQQQIRAGAPPSLLQGTHRNQLLETQQWAVVLRLQC